jgi:serine phosphatase RsbU (regulator of sigma subunit)
MAMQILRKDMELGSSAQALYLPETWHGDMHRVAYRSVFQPYGPMSGDWVQIFNLGEQTIIALGDVVGKGPSAALNTAVIASLWVQHKNKWQKTQKIDLEDFVRELNTTIFGLFRGRQFTTLHLAAIRPEHLELYNFGAPPWLAINGEKKIRSLRHPTRNPIGLLAEEPKVTKLDYVLAENEILIGYSDGAIDGPGARRRLEAELQKQSGALSFELLDQLVKSACVEGRLPDDYTLLMLQRKIT